MSREAEEGTQTPSITPNQEELLVRTFERIFQRISQTVPGLQSLPSKPIEPSKEHQKTIKRFMDLIDEDIKKYAEDLIRNEIRDKILSKGQSGIDLIEGALKRGRKPKLKRKKGCIFIQFGEGTPDDPIDEVLIAST